MKVGGRKALAALPRERTLVSFVQEGLRAGQDARGKSHPNWGSSTKLSNPQHLVRPSMLSQPPNTLINLQNIITPLDTILSNFTYMIFRPCTIWCNDLPFVSGINRNIKMMAFKHITLW
jgi:hypothetical protein